MKTLIIYYIITIVVVILAVVLKVLKINQTNKKIDWILSQIWLKVKIKQYLSNKQLVLYWIKILFKEIKLRIINPKTFFLSKIHSNIQLHRLIKKRKEKKKRKNYITIEIITKKVLLKLL